MMINSVTPTSLSAQQIHQNMQAMYEKSKKPNLDGRFKPNEIRMVAARVLGRSTDANCQVLGAVIELSFGPIKGNYSNSARHEASNLLKTTPQDSLSKRISWYVVRFAFSRRSSAFLEWFEFYKSKATEHLPVLDRRPLNRSDAENKVRELEVKACMNHLSQPEPSKSPFVKCEENEIRRLETNNWLVAKMNEHFKWLSELGFKHGAIATVVLTLRAGINALMNIPGYNMWRDPNDLSNHSTNPEDPTEFCRYFINYSGFNEQRSSLDAYCKNAKMDELADQFMTCQKNPLWARLTYMTPTLLGWTATIAITTVAISFLRMLAKQYLASLAQSKEIVEDEVQNTLKKRYVIQIQSLAKDFVTFGNTAATNSINEAKEDVIAFRDYQSIAERLQENAPEIVMSLDLLEKDQREAVMKALLEASAVILKASKTN